MVFVGSRKELLRISSHFEDTWISFIHAFNRLENDQAQMEALLKQAEILRNEINRKRETLSDERVKEVLSGLWTILENIWTQLHEMVENMPEMEEMEFSLYKKNLKKEIKRAKGDITLCADALKEYEKKRDQKTTEVTPKLSRREFFQKAGQFTKKSLALALIGSLELTPIMYTYLLALSKDLPLKKEDGLAILISYGTFYGWDTVLKPFGKLFVPTYVARVEIAFGQKANIVKPGATSKDLFDVLHDKAIQNIVVFGHGSWDTWTATDRVVKSKELSYNGWENDHKNGLFVRHTCGTGRTKDWGLLFDEKRSKELIKECEIINQKIKKIDKEIDFHLEFSVKYEYIILYWKNNDLNNYILSGDSIAFKLNDRSSFDDIKEKIIHRIRNNYGSSPSFPIIMIKMIHLLNHLESYLAENTVEREGIIPRFGTPHYPLSRIKGWDQTSYPWDYMIDVFGDRKLDQLYAKK